MDKIAIKGHLPKNIVDLDFTVRKNIKNYAEAANKR